MTWLLIAALFILLALAAAYLVYRLLLGSPFEDAGESRESSVSLVSSRLWRRRRLWFFSSAVAAAAALAVAVGHDAFRESWHQGARRSALVREAARLPPGQALIIGDSIVEGSDLVRLCSRPVLNAGIGGTGASEWADYGPRLIASARPSLVVVALGIVDARRDVDPALWEADYRRILAAARGRRVVLVSLHPIEAGKSGGPTIDMEQVGRLNAVLARLAREHGAALVGSPATADGLTTDGVHLNPSGYAGWRRRLEGTCPAAPR